MCIMIFDMTLGTIRMARATAGAALICVTLVTSGCLQPPVKEDVQMATTPEQVRRAPTQPALRPTDPEAEKAQQKAATAAKQPEQTAAPAALIEAPVYSANELVGKSQTEVTALIGSPARVEQRAASTVWTYRKEECGLDVFFFLDMATSDERVLTVESTTDPAAASAAAAAGTTDGAAAPATATAAAASTVTSGGSASGTASDASGGSVVDTCYGKLRRS